MILLAVASFDRQSVVRNSENDSFFVKVNLRMDSDLNLELMPVESSRR